MHIPDANIQAVWKAHRKLYKTAVRDVKRGMIERARRTFQLAEALERKARALSDEKDAWTNN